MTTINRLLKNEYVFEYAIEYGLKKRKLYSGPTLYDAGGDLSKRWYVYYSFRNPESGKLERQPPIYADLESYKTLRERNRAGKALKQSVKEILEDGFNPYGPDAVNTKVENKGVVSINSAMTLKEAIAFSLTMANKLYAESAYPDFKSRVNQFATWATLNGKADVKINDIEPIDIINFLNEVLQRSSASNRNNTRVAISSFYKILKTNQIVKENIVEGIALLTSKPKKNKTFTTDQEENILKLLAQKDPVLDLFVKFISINLLRPIEVCRLQVENIDITGKQLMVKAKNQPVKTKIIPSMLLEVLPDILNCNPKDYLFTPNGVGQWDAKEVNRRNYFSDRFKKIKDELGLGTEYGLYSFRHTYITKLYREIRKEYTPFEAKSRLMLITGHSTMSALEKYLRDIDAELPEDYSYLLK